jgi:hypothetical protein
MIANTFLKSLKLNLILMAKESSAINTLKNISSVAGLVTARKEAKRKCAFLRHLKDL